MNATTTAPDAQATADEHCRQSDIAQFWALYNRPHLWPEERTELRFYAARLGVRLKWFTINIGDPKAKPVPMPDEATT
jgi:hypothetical protein